MAPEKWNRIEMREPKTFEDQRQKILGTKGFACAACCVAGSYVLAGNNACVRSIRSHIILILRVFYGTIDFIQNQTYIIVDRLVLLIH